jgi:hypothetical protein
MTQEINRHKEILPLAARTATAAGTSSVHNNRYHRGVLLVVRVTAGASSPSVVPAIQGYDPTSGVYFDLHGDMAAITSTSAATYTYLLYPGASETEGSGGIVLASSGCLPPQWRVIMTHGNSDSLTYSVSALLLV